jgi:uncharacterized protein (UPF0332 family)
VFDPVRFFLLARKLATGDESALRTSVSRAYYASFLVARERLGLSHERIPDVHYRVIVELHRRSHLVATQLHRLRQMRNRADYDLNLSIGGRDAQEALALAEGILRWLGALR